MPTEKDTIRQFLERIRDERMTHANTATRIGSAMIMILDYLTGDDSPFLSKEREDSTSFLLRLLAGAVIGEAGEIRLNPDGSITCGRILVEGSAIFNEIVFNHQNVLEGDTFFTDNAIIEEVEQVTPDEWKLTMRKLYDDDRVTFHAYDCLRIVMNNLDRARTYKTSWARVNSVDVENNVLMVSLYDGEDVPGGVNYPPEPSAKAIRWGNPADETRQAVMFVSSTDGRWLFLQGVTKPIIDQTNYSAFLGLPPDLPFLRDLPINRNHPYLYARGLIVQDIIQLDYQGNPQYTARDCGLWDSTRRYIHGFDETEQRYVTDHVWHGGCYFRAAVSAPSVGREPRFNNPDWVCLLGGANMTLDIISTAGDTFRGGTVWSTELVAVLYNAEMRILEEEIGRENIQWTRESEDTAGDEAWNLRHPKGSTGFRLAVSSDTDVSGQWEGGSQVAFRCSVVIGETELSETYTTTT